MKRIIFTLPDGGLSVTVPSEGSRLAYWVTRPDGSLFPNDSKERVAPFPADIVFRRWPVEGATAEWAESEDAFVARIAKKDVPADATNVQIVDESAIPTDRTFRSAWVAVDGRVDHDMGKARAIHKVRLRELRAPLFETIERAQRTALAKGDTTLARTLEAKLQALRDVTDDPAIAKAATVEELKAAIPAVLIRQSVA